MSDADRAALAKADAMKAVTVAFMEALDVNHLDGDGDWRYAAVALGVTLGAIAEASGHRDQVLLIASAAAQGIISGELLD